MIKKQRAVKKEKNHSMAIYHFSGTVISRGQGRSAIAAAAYRAGEKIYDVRHDRAMNYSNKKDVAYKEILLPEKAPEWMKDRSKLWNAVEASETRKDSQLAREIQLSLPAELSRDQNIKLAREFVQDQFVVRGMVADMCIHEGKTKEGDSQPHAHIMLTTREVTEDGFGLKERSWNAKENMLLWREAWAEYANRYLALNGIEQKIDHRSYEERGIDLIPQKKIGANNLKDYERRVEEHRQIAEENGNRIYEEPTIALNAITHHQSTFSMQDLARFINRHTVNAEQFQRVYEKVQSSELIVSLGKDARGNERFTTKEMLDVEQRMLSDVAQLQNKGHSILGNHQDYKNNQNTENHQEGISNRAGASLSDQQQIALEHIVGQGDIKCLVGYAGTGKSHLLSEARELWEASGYKVHGITLSGIAAENLEGSSGIESRTYASMSYYWDAGWHLSKNDILVIDEAGMLGTRQLAKVVDEAKTMGAKVVLIGDPQQLQAIEAGAAFRAISDKTSYVELTEVRRQQEAWQQQATKEFATKDVEVALNRYDEHNHVHNFDAQIEAKTSMVNVWNDVRISEPDKSQIMLAYTRKDAQELNEIARDMRKQNSELGTDHILKTSTGNKAFAEGDRIYFLRNNRDLGVMNGTLGTIERIKDNKITVISDKDDFDGNKKTVSFDIRDYEYITHGYAATIHKAQGVTVDRSYLLASRYLDSHATYVGMSRHRESADLFWSKEEFNNRQTLLFALGRDRSKEMALDYFEGQEGRGTVEGLLNPGNVEDKAKTASKEQLNGLEEGVINNLGENSLEYQKPIVEQEAKENFDAKIARITKECSKLINSINSDSNLLEKFIKEDGDSPFLKGRINETKAETKQYIQDHCNDKEILVYLKEHESKLFNAIDKDLDNIATNTIEECELKELLASLTKDNPGRYDQILSIENKYNELKAVYLDAFQAKEKMKEVDVGEFMKWFDITKAAKVELSRCAQEICSDIEIAKVISQYNPDLCSDVDKSFDNMLTKILEENEQNKQYIQKYPELEKALSREDRTNMVLEQYQELKEAYLEAYQTKESLKGGDFEGFSKSFDTTKAAKDELDRYVYAIYKDNDLVESLKETDEKTQEEIQGRFNEFERENLERMQELQKEVER